MNKCEHITRCSKCEKIICSYCIEDCSGCGIEACKECYSEHQSKCNICNSELCPTELMANKMCAVCDMKDEQFKV